MLKLIVKKQYPGFLYLEFRTINKHENYDIYLGTKKNRLKLIYDLTDEELIVRIPFLNNELPNNTWLSIFGDSELLFLQRIHLCKAIIIDSYRFETDETIVDKIQVAENKEVTNEKSKHYIGNEITVDLTKISLDASKYVYGRIEDAI